ncbi:hypothetical protein [Mycolicibacterium sp. HS_4_1]
MPSFPAQPQPSDQDVYQTGSTPKGEKRTLRLVARHAQRWDFGDGTNVTEFARKRDVLAAHCADIARNAREFTLCAHLRLESDRNYGQIVEQAAALEPEGLDLAVIYLDPPHDPAILEPLAEAIQASDLLRHAATWN